ncbi:MAG: type IX secretion system PorP/SprF family membrane protein [Flavobacteriaceae bacterium]|jgi:type IX secretion system PorP/SprF family membrane protein
MKTIKLIVLFILLGASHVEAQQDGHYINTINNPFIVNPAAGGLSDVMQLELTSRSQWLGYSNSPRAMIFNGFSPIKIGKSSEGLSEFNYKDRALFEAPERSIGLIKHVVGGRALIESIGPFQKTSVHGSYAIHLPFSKNYNISAGLGIGWSSLGIIQDRVVLFQEDDISYSEFLGNTSSQNILDASAGVTLYSKNLFVGFSSTQVLKNKAVFADVVTESNFNRHYYIIAKYNFEMGDLMSLEPSVVGKLVENSPFSADLGIRAIYKKSAWIGLQYRLTNAVTLQVGANIIKNLYVSYGYEHSLGAIRSANNGTHEIQLGFYLGNNRNLDKERKDAEQAE